MKHLLLTTIAAVALVGCGELQQSVPSPEVKPVAEAAQPEPPTAKGWTPPVISIHKAAGRGDIEGVKQYLVSGVDVNAKGRFGETPLDWAIDEDRTETADLLRKHGGKHSTINMAAWSGDAKGVKEFLAAGSDVNAKDKYGRTPLHLAAEEGHKEIVELLISKGADLNAKGGRFGRTPLHQAATKEIAELLIAKGADVNAKFESGKLKGQTPLDLANWSNRKQTADLLRKHGGKTGEELEAAGKPTEPVAEAAQPEPPTAKAPAISLFDAADRGNIEAVKQHLAAGTAVQHKNNVGWTSPLHRAATWGHKEIVGLLIAAGADVNAKGNGNGTTPLDVAIQTKQYPTADFLRKHGGKTGDELKAEGK